MLAILARRDDPGAAALAARWADHDAAVCTCADLSAPGWHDPLDDGEVGTAVLGGRTVGVAAITGVFVRLPWVSEDELPHVAAEDRSYVAAEMSAFLVAWLSRLRCPVVNRPSPVGLGGPSWRQEQWLHLAGRLGVPVRPLRRQVALAAEDPPPYAGESVTVTVVGSHTFGAEDPTLREHARRLANAAEMDLLAVHFSGPEADATLVGVDPWPDVSPPEVADALLEHLSHRGAA
jgi:hypothetical protein